MDLKSLCRKIALGATWLATLTAAYYVGVHQRPSFTELPEKARQVIEQEHEHAKQLLINAEKDIKNGQLIVAAKKYKYAEEELVPLAKIDPKYNELRTIIGAYEGHIKDIVVAQNFLNERTKLIQRKDKLEQIAHDITTNYGNWEVRQEIIERLGPWGITNYYLIIQPNIQKAMLTAYIDLLNEWIEIHKSVAKKLKEENMGSPEFTKILAGRITAIQAKIKVAEEFIANLQ